MIGGIFIKGCERLKGDTLSKVPYMLSITLISALGVISMIIPLNVFASENNTNFLNPNFNNMSVSQASRMGDISEQARNYTSHAIQTAGGNVTKLYSILLNDSVKKGFLTEKEKDTLSPYIFGVTQNDSAKHLSTIKKDISSLLEGFAHNNSSTNLIALTSVLNNSISNIDNQQFSHNILSNIGITPQSHLTIRVSDSAAMCFASIMLGMGAFKGPGIIMGAALGC